MHPQKLATALITLSFLALPLAAQASAHAPGQVLSSLPSAVLWLGGIAGFLGFLLGSIPPHDPDGGWKFDLLGAFAWAIAGSGVVGGLALHFNTGDWLVAGCAIGAGLLVALARFALTRPPRVPTSGDLNDGVNRAAGDSTEAKFKAAQRMYKAASFHDGNYYATRSPRDFRFDEHGMTAEVAGALYQGLAQPSRGTFDILVLLVRELPGEPGQPAVVVVRGGANLKQVQLGKSTITLPGLSDTIPFKSIAATVGYAWR
jgi:hypothetical protein